MAKSGTSSSHRKLFGICLSTRNLSLSQSFEEHEAFVGGTGDNEVKGSKASTKLLDLLYRSGRGHTHYCLDLCGVELNASMGDHIPQKLSSGILISSQTPP